MDAPAGLLPLSRPLMTGEVLDAAFRLFRAGLLRCLPYSGLAVLTIEFPTFYSTLLTEAPISGVASTGFRGRIVEYAVVFTSFTLLLGLIALRLQAIAAGGRVSAPRSSPRCRAGRSR
jgi:hypothetical protein